MGLAVGAWGLPTWDWFCQPDILLTEAFLNELGVFSSTEPGPEAGRAVVAPQPWVEVALVSLPYPKRGLPKAIQKLRHALLRIIGSPHTGRQLLNP